MVEKEVIIIPVPGLLLILESFGTSEMLLILVVALIFFGPRKLPQISRQIGKSLADFRKASEDFKRTWEREVALETHVEPDPNQSILPRDNSIRDTTVGRNQAYNTLPEDQAVANLESTPEPASFQNSTEPAQSEPAPKHDWL
jgi:Tat protein translocase TatB subunit